MKKITVITVCLNAASELEKTIKIQKEWISHKIL